MLCGFFLAFLALLTQIFVILFYYHGRCSLSHYKYMFAFYFCVEFRRAGFYCAVCPCHSVRLESRGRAGVKGAFSFLNSPSASDEAEM